MRWQCRKVCRFKFVKNTKPSFLIHRTVAHGVTRPTFAHPQFWSGFEDDHEDEDDWKFHTNMRWTFWLRWTHNPSNTMKTDLSPVRCFFAAIIFSLIAFSPAIGSVEVPNAEDFTLLKIDGMPASPKNLLPEFRLAGYEWRIYHRPVGK